MFATTKVCASKISSLVEVIVPKFTATLSWKKSLTCCSLGEVPGGVTAKAIWAMDKTFESTIAWVSSLLKPAFAARSRRAAVECIKDEASFKGTAMANFY